MRAPVFLVDVLPETDQTVLDGPEGRHAATVRRIRAGEHIHLSDGTGGLAECTVVGTEHDQLALAVLRRSRLRPPDPRFVVVQALPKGDRGELAVELLTEVGADEIVPWASARTVPQWRGERGERALARWRSTAREAAKQSRRAWLPYVTDVHTTRQVCALIAGSAGAVVLDQDARLPLAETPLPSSGDILVVIGPEGGLTEGEVTAFRASGARPARLGPTVLRTSTAGPAALSVLSVRTDRWR
ncbi:MAG TPA: 16S rRNA (uracil(1498)-N(3))-methyltransferase [Mycobacteriales bacterium]|nr:16S rRNA (uracil(1498)-N(3))-methyltransferase [Mycobacteriales bacterium]